MSEQFKRRRTHDAHWTTQFDGESLYFIDPKKEYWCDSNTKSANFTLFMKWILMCPNNPDIIELLKNHLKYESDIINKSNDQGWTPLMLAVVICDDQLVTSLIEAGANLNVQNKNGHTALMIAVQNTNDIIVKMLIEAGADLDIQIKNGKTALLQAVAKVENTKIVKMLIANKSNPNIKMDNGWTSLMLAVQYIGNEESVKILIDSGVGINT